MAPVKRDRDGNVLMMTMLIMTVIAALAGITLTVTSSTTWNTGQGRTFAKSQATAEGALEYAYGIWMKRVNNKHDKITTNEANAGITGTNGFTAGLNGINSTNGDVEIRIDALDEYGVPVTSGTAIPSGVLGQVPGYEGWHGQTFTYSAQAKVHMANGSVIGVRRLFQYTQVPLFQSMFFFEHDLEFYRPAEMIIQGLIHSNGKTYFSADAGSLKIKDYISYVTSYSDYVPPYGYLWSAPTSSYGPYFWDGSAWVSSPGRDAKGVPLATPSPEYATELANHTHQVARIEPMGASPEQAFKDKGTNPNVAGEFHELIEPPDPNYTDPDAISTRRLINKAGIVINVSGTSLPQDATFTSTYDASKKATVYQSAASSVTISVPDQSGTTISADGAKAIANAISKVKGTPAYKIVTSSTDSRGRVTSSTNSYTATGLYDAREETYVDTLNLDISAVKAAIQPASGSATVNNFNGVLYINDTTQATQNPSPSADDSINTIRLVNGSVLPDTGLTIASENPVYVQGDYNTGGTGTNVYSNKTGNPNNADSPTTVNSNKDPTYTPKPAAIIADAVMLLSSNWKDSNSAKSVSGRTAVNTTYNMAIMAGFNPSSSKGYSGGANNFPRYLESWSGKTCTYWGSMVELFPSKTFTGQWDTTGIYDPPKRCWNFDTRFLKTPPPGSVDAIILTRGPWSRM